MHLLRDGSRWWRNVNYDQVDVAPAADLVVVKSQPVLPRVIVGPGATPATQGDPVPQGDRIVVLSITLTAHPSTECILKLMSREDPNSTAVLRPLATFLCPANANTIVDAQHPAGLACPTREGVPAANANADLVLGCFGANGLVQNFSAAFGASSQLSLTVSGVTVGARNKRWDGFNG